MEIVEQLQLLGLDHLLKLGPGSNFVSIVAETEPEQYKRNNPFFPIRKLEKVTGILNFDYESNVRKATEDLYFEVDENTWHEPILIDGKFTPFCRHKRTGEIYIRFRLLKSDPQPRYFDSSNQELEKNQIEAFLKPNRNTGLIYVRTFKLSSVKEIISKKLEG